MIHKGFTLWLTGMSGAGKSTISEELIARFRGAGAKIELLDGDIVRTNLSQGLGFSREDRDTNVRRIGFVSDLLSRNGVIVVVAAISPYRSTREEVKRGIANFVEVFAGSGAALGTVADQGKRAVFGFNFLEANLHGVIAVVVDGFGGDIPAAAKGAN